MTALQEDAAGWVLRERDGLDEAEQQARDAWLAAHADHRAAYDRLKRAWQSLDALRDDPGIGALREQALEPATASPRWRRAGWGMAMAASLVAALAGWWALSPQPAVPQVFETAHGQTRDLALADGSHIMLDADSRVTVRMGKDLRAISLDRGQAYFTVAHAPDRPFVVTAGLRAVEALGTQFDVKRSGRGVLVALTQGRVRVGPAGTAPGDLRPGSPGQGDELSVGQTLTFDAGTDTTLIAGSGAQEASDWRAGRLHFARTPLGEALADFNRHGRLPIRLDDPHLAALPVSGVFEAGNAEGFLRALPLLFPVRVDHRADGVVVSAAR